MSNSLRDLTVLPEHIIQCCQRNYVSGGRIMYQGFIKCEERCYNLESTLSRLEDSSASLN